MASQKVELEIFKQFAALMPNFAGRAIASVTPGSNPPDILCVDQAGDKIGVELSEWLHQQQTAREKPRHIREAALRKIINSATVSPPEQIGSLQLFARANVRLNSAELPAFRDQLYALIDEVEKKWVTFRGHDHPQGVTTKDFAQYPLVSKYVTGLLFTSRRFRTPVDGTAWITFFSHGGAYSPQTARVALEQALSKKTRKYAALRSAAGLKELYLLLYYDQAHFYNTPFDAPGFGFPEIVAHFARIAEKDHGVFEKIFLCIPAKNLAAQVF